jgi:uncharacterized protein YbjT (DUF2867 family)
MRARRPFIAGATGATGRVVLRLAEARGADFVAHRRPRPGREPAARFADFPLEARESLTAALRGCTTVLQLVGTMRRRFAQGDTYETSDVGTTRLLVDAAREAGVDHVVLLSSAGAGRPVGAYLQAKARAEALVTGSGLAYTVVRPSAFDGEGHRPPPGMGMVTRLPGLRPYRPIPIEALAQALLHVALERAPLNAVLEGESLWDVVAASGWTGGR